MADLNLTPLRIYDWHSECYVKQTAELNVKGFADEINVRTAL